MKRFCVICLQTALFLVTCRVMAQIFQVTTVQPLGITEIRNKALRQGIDEDATPRGSDRDPGPPKRDCVCSKIYDPVCASNNESYYNLCYLECKVPKTENVSVIHQGNCIPF